MGLFRMKHCFCCFSLKSGVLIILWMQMIGAFLSLCSNGLPLMSGEHSRTPLVVKIVTIAICIAGLYAMEKRRPSMLIPYLFCHTLSCIMILALAVIFPLVWLSIPFDEIFKQIVNGDANMTVEEQEKLYEYSKTAGFLLVETMIVFFAVLNTYLLLVVYSYYKVLVQELQTGVLFEVPAAIENTSNKEHASNLYRDWKTDETTMAFSPPPPYAPPSYENGPYPYKV